MDDELTRARERLKKLWTAYQTQERELDAALKKIESLEIRLKEKEKMIETLREVLEAREKEIKDLQMKNIELEGTIEELRPRIKELEEMHEKDLERYAKLFTLTEDLEAELERVRKEMALRDKWFEENLKPMYNLCQSLYEREKLLEGVKGEERGDFRKRLDELSPEGEAVKKGEKAPKEEKVKFEKLSAEDVLKGLLGDIRNMTEERIAALAAAGYDSEEALRKASVFDLMKVDGISPTLAKKIKERFPQ
ncbi:MAG: hypothetical protein J7L88_04225 [Thermoplasmata archaeon]|nr:hypothetical protein [Thermoplasmata archaeon]